MGIITGYLCVVSLLLTMGKFIGRVSKNQKCNAFFRKIHKPSCVAFLTISLVHFILILPVFENRSIAVLLSGIFMVILMWGLITACHIMKKPKKMRWHRIFSIMLLFLLVCHFVTYFIDFANYQEAIKCITITETDLTQLPDGDYVGEYDAGYIYAKVCVTLENHQITEVTLLEHRNEHGQPAEQMIPSMITENRIDVDTISGATNSGQVIKQACMNALCLQ